MKTTARILAGVVTLTVGFTSFLCHAGPPSGGLHAALGAALPGQASAPDKKAQADDLIRRARQAMAENDLEGAETLVSRAEALEVNYGRLSFGDTPAKARRDLDQKRQAVSGETSGPGRLFSLPFKKKSEVTDPFTARRKEASEPPANREAGAITSLPPVGKAAPAAGAPSANRPESDDLLRAARRALALGDVPRSTALAERARALKVNYAAGDDSPARVELAIKKYQDLKAQPRDRRSTEGYRRQTAKLQMEQALALMHWKEFDEAERLARDAQRQGVLYSPFEAKPETLLKQIDAARRAVAPGQLAGHAVSAPIGGAAPSMAAKQQAAALVGRARGALAAGDLDAAEALGRQAERMQIPESGFRPGEDRPSFVLRDVRQQRLQGGSPVRQAAGQFPVSPATGRFDPNQRASRAVYNPQRDPTRLRQAAAGQASAGMALFKRGEAAIRSGDAAAAMKYFQQAAAYQNEFDPQTRQRLQDYLQMPTTRGAAGRATSMLDETLTKQQALLRQVYADVTQQESVAMRMREKDPKGAIALMQETREKVAAAGLEPSAREQLLHRIDRNVERTRKYIEENQPRIQLDERNRQVTEDVERSRELKLEIQGKMAAMVEEFNRLMDEQRFAEAELIAKRANEMAPGDPLAIQLLYQSKFIHRFYNNLAVQRGKEESFINQLSDVEDAAIMPVGDANPMVFPDEQTWERISQSRWRLMAEQRRGRTERELEIEQKLKTPVTLQFPNAPLSTVIDYLAKLADVNIHLDPQGLAEEGISSDTPVSISLSKEVSLKSALNLVLEPLHLSYVIKDEVLKVTSEQLRDGEVYTVTYSVADLVVPIPNFVPSNNMGLAGAYHDALGSVGFGGNGSFGGGAAPMAVVASRDGAPNSAMISPTVMGQLNMPGGQTGGGGSSNMPMGFGGPGGMGGGAMADFDSLIELITSTIKPTTWDDVGGPGSIAPFETNLSIVVSQTQDVHEEIVDLLEQLRRLQDLQVTIEVRFITLQDNFFERIGIDFDFDIDDNIDRDFMLFGRPALDDDGSIVYADDDRNNLMLRNTSDTDSIYDRSVGVGMSSAGAGVSLGAFSADLDIPFRQNSYGVTVPQFGGYDPATNAGASLGFAILSEIEAYFFIEAAQSDVRTNVLQAPKVTLFNGQQAFVSDTSQSPFVISVIPVVGDFAAAQQPVIVVLNEGTFLTVQAVVSNDRRFVRLTVVPFFSRIDEVNTFQFTGTETTTAETDDQGNQETPNDNTRSQQSVTTSNSGTTVQLPTFSFVTVTTTVSVPDGGTVLLGGIKRLSEERREAGVPMLNKIPYLNRLFSNVGIGRTTSSLMMMVTPRIIIQEEEEERLGIQP